jgi:hypothetical protein
MAAPFKLRLNVDYNGKKFMMLITDANTTMAKLKEMLIPKLGDPLQPADFVVVNDRDFQLDSDLNELAGTLLDDKDVIIVKRVGAAPAPPLSSVSAPAPAPSPPPAKPALGPVALVGPKIVLEALPPRWEDTFKFRIFAKETGFAKAGTFGLPQDTDVLYDYLAKLRKTLPNCPDNTELCLYHESGAPVSANIAQQRLIMCREVIVKDQYYYLIMVPKNIDPHKPYELKDPAAGKHQIRVDLKGRVFPVRVDLGATTVFELKQKTAMLAKVSPRRLRVFIGIDELLDESILTEEQMKANDTLIMEINTGRTKAFLENFNVADAVSGQSAAGMREFWYSSF